MIIEYSPHHSHNRNCLTSNFVSFSFSFLIGFQVWVSLFSFSHNCWLPILFLHTTHTAAIVDFQFCFLFFQFSLLIGFQVWVSLFSFSHNGWPPILFLILPVFFSHWLPGVGFTFFFQPQLLTSNFVSYSSSFLIGIQVWVSLFLSFVRVTWDER